MSNYYEFLKAPEDEISVSWPGETKSYKLSDIKSLESQLREAVALLKVYKFALKQYEIMSPTRLDEHEFYTSIAKKALSAPIPESIRGLLE